MSPRAVSQALDLPVHPHCGSTKPLPRAIGNAPPGIDLNATGKIGEAMVVTDIRAGWRAVAIGQAISCHSDSQRHRLGQRQRIHQSDTLTQYCAERGIEFTRSRPYRKNDQAWIEQKNGAVVRHFAGHDRYSDAVAGQTIAHLYGAVRRYVNYFQPSFKLVEKTRHGSRVVKRYSPPATPCDRLMQHDAVSVEMKAALSEYRVQLDPVALLHAIREAQSALAAVTFPKIRPTPSGESLEEFLTKLPDWWRQDAAHTSRERRVQPPRTWRTRPDPFEGVWCDVLSWLQEDPDASAVVLLGRLQEAEPDRFSRAHLRTLQRRVQQWRGSGAASWPKSWSTPRLVSPWRDSLQCRN